MGGRKTKHGRVFRNRGVSTLHSCRGGAGRDRTVADASLSSDDKFSNYIIMWLYPQTLHEYIRSSRFSKRGFAHKIKVALDIAKALQFLHENEIIHCDVHSANVLVDPANGPVS